MAAKKRGGRKTTTAGRKTSRRAQTTRIEGGKGKKVRGATVRERGTPRELSRTATATRARRATDPANNPNGIIR